MTRMFGNLKCLLFFMLKFTFLYFNKVQILVKWFCKKMSKYWLACQQKLPSNQFSKLWTKPYSTSVHSIVAGENPWNYQMTPNHHHQLRSRRLLDRRHHIDAWGERYLQLSQGNIKHEGTHNRRSTRSRRPRLLLVSSPSGFCLIRWAHRIVF